MAETTKARIGLLGLMLELYDRWSELKPLMAGFASELATTLAPFAEVDFPGVCNTRAAVDEAIAGFERDEKDLIIVVLLTYAPSHIALPGLVRARLPILLYNTQRLEGVTAATSSDDTTHNHGMHGVQDLAIVLYQCARELVHNVAKHASATSAKVELEVGDGEALLTVTDDGKGFDASPTPRAGGGFGLLSLRERVALSGGELSIESREGGSRVSVRLPLQGSRTNPGPALQNALSTGRHSAVARPCPDRNHRHRGRSRPVAAPAVSFLVGARLSGGA